MFITKLKLTSTLAKVSSFSKRFLLILLLLKSTIIFSQSFYGEKNVQTIELFFDFSDWKTRLDTAAQGQEGYTVAKWCKINGKQFDNVGAKFKGNSSYKASNKKNPLHIELDYKKEQDYQGYTNVKLSNVFADPTFVREPLAYDILRKYMDAPDCNLAKVYINGQFYGLMTNTESINKAFLNSRFSENDGAFFKCNPIGGAGAGSSAGYPSLVYIGNDSSKYTGAYELKSDKGWANLLRMIDTLNNFSNAIERNIDIDRTLWMLAFNNIFVNLDSYSGAFAQNYYLYQDESKRFLPIVWDLNMSFGGFTRTGESPQLSIAALPKLNPLLHQTSADRPLIKQLLANPSYKKMYIAKMKTILKENISNSKYYSKAIEIQQLIDSIVKRDNNKFFTYAQFSENMTQPSSGAGAGGTNGVVPGLKSLMDERLIFLNAHAQFNVQSPQIDTVIAPSSVNNNTIFNIKAKVSNAIKVELRYRFTKRGVFSVEKMFDDGLHNDLAANDGIYGVNLKIGNSNADFYIYAENNDAAIFSPERAEHEFYNIKSLISNSVKLKYNELTINELVASNKSIIKDEAGQFEDYIEIKNNKNIDLNISGAYLSDDKENPFKWQFKENTVIPANGYLLVFADEDASQGDFHSNFKLSSNGEKLILTAPDSTLLDSLTFPKLKDDASYSRCPDGTGTFKIVQATPKTMNTCQPLASNDADNQYIIKIFPNPATNELNVICNENEAKNVYIYNQLGQLIYTSIINESIKIDVSNWQKGFYLLKIENKMVKFILR